MRSSPVYTLAKNKNISVAEFLLNNSIESQFHIPLSAQAHEELIKLQELIQDIQIQEHSKDTWQYIWGSSVYSSKKCYNLPYKHISTPQPLKWIWDSRCCNKLRVFSWLLLMDRLSTRNLLRRKNFKVGNDDYNCVLCSLRTEETAFHLFFSCPFSKRCWNSLGILGLRHTLLQSYDLCQE